MNGTDDVMYAPLRVLVVEDEPADVELILDDLRNDGIACVDRCVETEADYLDALDSFAPDIVLSDLKLPGFDGYQALALLRERDALLPFIFVSGTIGETVAVQALQQGATDYILKNNTIRLAAAVRRAMHEAQEKRAREHAEQELVRAQRFESLALLAGGLSHDLRNLLQPLLLAADTLEEYRDDQRLANLGDLVRDCGQRGLDMVMSMLSFARGTRRNERVRVDELFQALGLLLKGSVPRSVELDIQAPTEKLTFPGNLTEMQQSLLNLCLNAVQAMPEGGRLSVSAQRQVLAASDMAPDETARPGVYVCLCVRDTGEGMSEQTLAELYQPFFTTKEGGTGLGLVSCRRIADSHGGVMRVESTVGEGTCFRMYLPERGIANTDISGPSAPRGHGEQILVVEEEAMPLSLLTTMLEDAGYAVHGSGSGTEALQFLQTGRLPHVVVMDADLNLLTGVRTLAALLEREYTGAVVLLTRPDAQPQREDLPPIEHLQMIDKPVQPADLLLAVDELLRASNG